MRLSSCISLDLLYIHNGDEPFGNKYSFCYSFRCPLDSADRAGRIRCHGTRFIASLLFVIYLFIFHTPNKSMGAY